MKDARYEDFHQRPACWWIGWTARSVETDGVCMKKVIYMAAECMLFEELGPDEFEAALFKFAELVRADEREACAKVIDEMAEDMEREIEPSTAVAYVRSKAAAIRARGQA